VQVHYMRVDSRPEADAPGGGGIPPSQTLPRVSLPRRPGRRPDLALRKELLQEEVREREMKEKERKEREEKEKEEGRRREREKKDKGGEGEGEGEGGGGGWRG